MREGLDLETTVLLISLAIIPVLVAIILLCLKIKSSKSNPDLYGVEGTVKKKEDGSYHPDTSDTKLNVSGEESRCEVRTPSYDRKLPDIPLNNEDIYKNSSTKDDNSELYATVDEVPSNNVLGARPDLLPAATAGHSSYDSKNHPYAKVKKTRRQEHPYAKVGESKSDDGAGGQDDDNTDTEEYDTTENLRPPQAGSRVGGPHGGPQSWSRRGDHGSRQSTPLPPEPLATGGGHYPDNSHGHYPEHAQQHFSGDSQDSFSAKGYTSISVREPLAMIRDIRAGQHQGSSGMVQEGNYVTLSETSDEMYAAIEDTVYMNPAGKKTHDKDEEESDPHNMYSKVDKVKKKNQRETKSYDASNPYATVNKPSGSSKQLSQSSDNLGARPKHRSPRSSGAEPEPAHGDRVDYSEYEVSHSDHVRQQHVFNMSQFDYNRVRPEPNYETLPGSGAGSERDPGYESVQHGDPRRQRPNRDLRDPDYETVNSEAKDPGYEVVSQPRHRVNSIDPMYETVPQKRDPGYETVKSKDPGYESVKGPVDPGYETVEHSSRAKPGSNSYGPRSFPADYESRDRDPGYESVGFRDPGYETVRQGRDKRAVSLEPGYEMLPDARQAGEDIQTGPSDMYSVVNKKGRAAPAARLPSASGSDEETGYETIPGDKRQDRYDPGYETLPPLGASNTQTESRYETVSQTEARYETINKPEGEPSESLDRLKDADIEYIDESGEDELEDGLADLKTGDSDNGDMRGYNGCITEDLTVESSHSSLIQMSVVDGGPGVRRSSVVVIEHLPGDTTQEQEPAGAGDSSQEIQTHIFV